MKTVGIICEYNPFHLGHAGHIEKTKEALDGDACIICVMSGNFVQRGDFAVFNKHARAKMAVLNGADVVIELPSPYALLSAGEFAKAGVYLLNELCICDYISFGSESGEIEQLRIAADVITTDRAQMHIKERMAQGLSYATAQQKAADEQLGEKSNIFGKPNNILAIEYIKAINEMKSPIQPITIKRFGGEHDSSTGYSATALRKILSNGDIPVENMPGAAIAVCMEEIVLERGPVYIKEAEQAIMARLRNIKDFSCISGSTDGLDRRFLKYATVMPTVISLIESIKSKRYAMSRIRRMLMCAVLNITNEDVKRPPPYIRILAMNEKGKETLRKARKLTKLPIITKPASIYKNNKQAVRIFELEAMATDFYALAYAKTDYRTGGGEWKQSPVIV